MNQSANKSRRRFLKASVAVGGGLALGIYFLNETEDNGKIIVRKLLKEQNVLNDESVFFPSVYFLITPQNDIIINNACSEMGQGVMTSIPMLIAEELDADWSRIQVKAAPAHNAFVNPSSGRQVTGGSRSVRGYWKALREAGATARHMLIEAAAQQWRVDMSECITENSQVIHRASNRAISYGDLSELAAQLPEPATVHLKSPDLYKFIGKPLLRLDVLDKVTGKAVFGIDVKLPNMLFASVQRCPVFGGKLKSVDDSKAKQVNGVKHIVVIDAGVAVVATHYAAALKGRDALSIKWDEGKNTNLNSNSIREMTQASMLDAKVIRDDGQNPDASMQLKVLEANYETPYLAHACMEPMNCTAHVQADQCDVWAPTQAQGTTQEAAAEHCGLSKEKVRVHTTYLGGGFGRRSEKDFVVDAVQLSKKLAVPVKVIWTREDDIQHDYYRPYSFHALRCDLDQNGNPLSWRHDLASPSILERFVPLAKSVLLGNDSTSTEGAENLPYNFPHIHVSYGWPKFDIPVGFWRSVGNSQNIFVTECFIDEIAAAGGHDPLQFRLGLLKDKPRYRAVLNLVAEKSNWNTPLPTGHARGLAVSHCFGSYVAQVAEISIDAVNNKIIVHRVVCAVDCGSVVNPDTVVAQIEGGVIFGLTAALYGKISIENGRVQQSNYHDYPCIRIQDAPQIEVNLIHSDTPPGGVGEIGVPPIAPAVANAVLALTGKPVRTLPIDVGKLIS